MILWRSKCGAATGDEDSDSWQAIDDSTTPPDAITGVSEDRP